MESSFNSKVDLALTRELKPLLITFEKAKEWEWSDLIRWLKSVKHLLDHHKSEAIPEKFTLAKRLQQCLNPALPQGLHLITLSIYDSILEERQNFETLSFFSTGFLPFFEYASSENQKAVVRLAKQFLYLDPGASLRNALIGIVTPLLPGLEEGTSNQDVEREVMNLFDAFAEKDKFGLFQAIWHALLKTSRARLGALNYLTKRIPKDSRTILEFMPEKTMLLSALAAGIHSDSILVQRSTIDLLISHFPILQNEGVFILEEKRAILELLFRLLAKRDSTLTRRIWEYVQLGENLPSEDIFENIKEEYIVPTLKDILHAKIDLTGISSQEKISKAIEPLVIAEAALDKDNLGTLLLRDISVSLISHVKDRKDQEIYGKEVCEKFSTMLRSDLCVNNVKLIWQALADTLEENCIGEVGDIMDVIYFYVTNFPISQKSYECMVPILDILYTNMHRLHNSLSISLKIIEILLSKTDIAVDIKSSISCFYRFYVEFSKNSEIPLKDLKRASLIAFSLARHGAPEFDWLSCIISFITNHKDVEKSLMGIEIAINLLKSDLEPYKNFLQKELGGLEDFFFNQLWKFLDQSKKRKKIVKLIWKLSDPITYILQAIQNNLALSKLNPPSEVKPRIDTLNRLNVLWNITRELNKSELINLFSRECILLILDKLEDPHPAVKHASKNFLKNASPEFSLFIDPLYESLLYTGISPLYPPVSYSFKIFKTLLSGNLFAYQNIEKMTLREKMQDLWFEYRRNIVNSEDVATYADLLTEVCVNYLVSPAANRKDRENQVSAGEVIELILSYGDRELAYRCVFRIMRSLKKIFEAKDGVMQLVLLNILNQILYNCRIETNKDRCKALLSINFISVLEDDNFLDGQDEYVRNHWVSFLIKSLDFVSERIDYDTFIKMASIVIEKLCAQVEISVNKKHLLLGIMAYLHYGLSISKPDAFAISEPDPHSLARESFFEGMFKRLLGSDSVPVIIAAIRISQEMFKEFEKVLECCLLCISDYDCEDIKAKGVNIFTAVKGKPIEDKVIKKLLDPIMVSRTYELIRASIAVWISRSASEVDPIPRTDQDLIKILRILTALDTPLDVVLEAIFKYLIDDLKLGSGNYRKNSGINRNQYESVAHFIYSLLSFYTKEKFESISKEPNIVWNEALRLLRILDTSEINSISLWILEITYLLIKRVGIDYVMSGDKSFAKGIRELMQKLMNQVVGYCMINEELDIEYPFPPSAYETDKISAPLTLCSLLTLKKTLYEISKAIWKDNPEKIASQIQYNTGVALKTLTSKTSNLDVDIMTDLLYSLLESGGRRLANTYKNLILDHVASNEFFSLMKSRKICLKHWCQIIKLISYQCYEDNKEQLIKEILRRMNKYNRSRILKSMIFVVYSGDIDDYNAALNTISEFLNEFLRVDKDSISTVLFCIRVLLVKLSPQLLSDIWPRIWPHTLTELLQILEANSKIPSCLAALKLIDTMIVLNIQEFIMHQFIFFYDSTACYDCLDEFDEGKDEYVPIIPRKYTRAPKTIKMMEVKQNIETIEKRILTMNVKAIDQNELDIKAKALAREIVRLSQVRSIPDEKNIKNSIEDDFLSDNY